MPIRALIFDFDGLILDTETTDYQVWNEIYQDYGCDLPISTWATIVGGAAESSFDPFDYLENQLGRPVNLEAIQARHRSRNSALIANQQVLPGVMNYLEDGKRLGLKFAIASSSPHSWVDTHLKRLGLYDEFEVIVCADDVQHTKPAPELFLSALKFLNVHRSQACVLEDSPNGILAAKRAGIYCVAIPNPITRQLPLGQPDLELASLEDLALESLIARVQNGQHE